MAKGSNSISRTAVWILLGLLIVGLAGFGTTNFSGTVRSVGSVGDAEIDIDDYARALRNEMNALQAQTGQVISLQQAQAFGVTQQVLSQLVVTAALEDETRTLGLSVGDAQVAEQLRGVAAFQGPDGQFNRDAYAFALRNSGLSEQEFEESLRLEAATSVLQGAVLAGTTLPDTYTDTLAAYALEERSVSWVALGAEALSTGMPVPDEAALQGFYEENIAAFTLPEAKRITYVWLTPDMILDTVEVDEEALRAAYAEREAEFNLPERRLVERLVMPDATAAAEALASGSSFEELVAERGLALVDVDLGDVTVEDLGDAAEAVFGAEIGAIVEGASEFGPALFRVNAVLAAQNTSFEDAIPALRGELALDRARRVIEAQAQEFDDELAAGATLEEMAELTELQLGEIAWTGGEADTIAGYEGFREVAQAVTDRDFPQIEQLGDGGVFALRLDDIREAAPQPFDEVREAVLAGFEAQARTDALVAQAEGLKTQIDGGTALEALGLTVETAEALTRNTQLPRLPLGLVQAAFEMAEGETRVLPGQESAVLLRLDVITAADLDSEGAQALSQFYGDQAASAVAQDLYRALASDIQTRAGVVIDQQAINAVHANMQ